MGEKKDFPDIIPIKRSDIEAFAKEGVSLPNGFEELYLKKDISYMRKNSREYGEVRYNIMMNIEKGLNNGKGGRIGEIGLNNWCDIEVNGNKISDCWARDVEIEKYHGVSYGQIGVTRAAIKALTKEMEKMEIENVCAFVMRDNEASLKMGQAVGWKEPIKEYKKDGKPSSEKSSYLFYAPVKEISEYLDNKTMSMTQTKHQESVSERISNLRNRINKNETKVPYKPAQNLSKIDFNTLKMYQEKKQNA